MISAAQTGVVNDPVASEINARIKPASEIVAVLNTDEIPTSTPLKIRYNTVSRKKMKR